ncbi:MAG: phage vB SenS, partial [Pseudomonadota bacterium]
MPAPKNPVQFTARARAIHGDKYTYTHTAEPQNIQKTRLTIVCPAHGEFEQLAYVHLRGLGCKQCGKDAAASAQRRLMTEKGETFVERARAIHGDRYDYSQTVYAGTAVDCTIICPEHGPFLQTAGNHLQGQHCGVCARRTAHSKTRHDINVFVERARATHGDKYDYSHAEYRGSTAKLTIVCPEHGAFDQVANQHIFGCGCPACGALAGGDAVRVTQAEWLERAKLVHSDLYDYSEVLYVNMHSKVGINCKKHGAFHQAAHSHLEGYGCPSCGYTISEAEREMVAFFESHGVEAQLGVAIGKQRVDVYLPHFHIAVEHDGEYFHSDLLPASIDPNDPKPGQRAGKYHKEKADAIAEHGVRVLQVWGTQWAHRRSLVEAILLRACGLGD